MKTIQVTLDDNDVVLLEALSQASGRSLEEEAGASLHRSLEGKRSQGGLEEAAGGLQHIEIREVSWPRIALLEPLQESEADEPDEEFSPFGRILIDPDKSTPADEE